MPAELTVRHLVADPALEMRPLAGTTGLDRIVRWAQTSEMVDPWAWLGPDELLMAVGLGMPTDPDAQVAFVRALDDAGIAGVLLGEDGLAPPLSDAMLAECERLGFPLLSTASTPFVVIARTVSAATTSSQSRSVLLLSRLYQAAARQDDAAKRSGRWVAELCGTAIAVVDDATGCVLIGDPAVREVAHRELALPAVRPAQLLLPRSNTIEAMTLVHLTQILTVDANAILQTALGAVADGAAQLRRAQDGAIEPADLDPAWADDAGFSVVAIDRGAEDRLAFTLALAGIRPLVGRIRDTSVAVVGARDLDAVRPLTSALGTPAGVSAPHTSFGDLVAAADEARSALVDALADDVPWCAFVGLRVSLLGRSRTEAASIVDTVLGPLADDAGTNPTLRDSLFTLLDHDLQWQPAADALGVHRQTLAYRIGRVEAVTGRSVRRVPDLAELWLARTAWRTLGHA